VKRLAVALALAAFAFPSGALAVAPALPPADRSPDERSVLLAPSSPAPHSDRSDFDWGDAGIGAGSAVALLALSLGSALTLRRRRSLAG
jgi:hypothetical protein